jgi:hypothetical protein
MPNENPLAGIVPKVVHPRIDGEAAITEYIEKIEGEVALDSYVKAQTSAPEVQATPLDYGIFGRL